MLDGRATRTECSTRASRRLDRERGGIFRPGEDRECNLDKYTPPAILSGRGSADMSPYITRRIWVLRTNDGWSGGPVQDIRLSGTDGPSDKRNPGGSWTNTAGGPGGLGLEQYHRSAMELLLGGCTRGDFVLGVWSPLRPSNCLCQLPPTLTLTCYSVLNRASPRVWAS